MSRRLAVNVDVDSLHLYHAIHGLGGQASDAAWTAGVPRFLELFRRLGLRATFFVVASDLERDAPRQVAAEAVAAGHELASHTWSHPYDLIRLSPERIREEIARAEAPLARLRGKPVAGFRAPGYNVSPAVLEVLAERGYVYDSSVFPSPPYYAARAAVIGAMALTGRTSRSIVGDPLAPFSRRGPHRVAGGRLVEVPISVLPGVRVPVIGTSLTMLGTAGARLLTPLLKRMSLLNLELHALDLLDAHDDVEAGLVRHQPDLRVRVATKEAIYGEVMGSFMKGDVENDTLENLARSIT